MTALLYRPDWPLPEGVRAAFSAGWPQASDCDDGFGEFNLAQHVGDDVAQVAANRQQLQQALGLQNSPLWLTQVHGVAVAEAGRDAQNIEADAAVSRQVGAAAAVMTADCLPVLFYSLTPSPVVAAAHAGWRGLCAGVLEQTVAAMKVDPSTIHCWLGPAIGPHQFEVGPEVKQAFVAHSYGAASAFTLAANNKCFANLAMLAQQRLAPLGVASITASHLCTVTDARFYSYRRAKGQPTGRMASLIWLEGSKQTGLLTKGQ